MKYIWPAGSTSKTTLLFIQDSASTTGAGQVSVSAGNIVAQAIRVLTNNTVAIATVSVTNLAALTDAYLSGGVFPVSSTLAPGWYRFDIPNSALSTGATTAGINIMGSLSASNIAQLVLEIQLQNVPSDMVAKAGVSVTVSTLFPVVVRQWDATSVSSSNLAVTDFSTRVNANVQQWATTSVSGSNLAIVDFSTRVNANVQQWSGKSTSTSDLAAFSVSQTVLTSATVGGSVDVGTWRGITVSASNIAIKNTLAKTTHITGFNDISQQTVSSVVFGSAMTESYAADGAEFTIPQGLYQIWSRLAEFSTSAQVITAMKLDGATTAMTFSLDSAVSPSKIERAT